MTQQEFTARYSYNPKSDQLGSGGFGSVYKAYDNEEDCFVALKIAAVDLQHPELRLRNEVAKAEHLKHKNVARYDACYTFPTLSGEIDIAVMRYYEHGSLDRFMRRGDLTLDERYDILTQILEGIAYLHSHGIIHRDLKPQNVLIVHHADKYIPKITDFGISKQLEDGESSLVSNSVLGGTRSYASPEQLCERALRKNTDLWSFGVIAYNMLLGELPFTTGTFSASSDEGRSEQLRQVLSGKLPEGINHLSEPWQSVIRGCLVVDGEKRLQHAEDCLEIISRGVTPEVDVEVEPIEDEKTVIGVSAQEADEKTTTDDERTRFAPTRTYNVGDYYNENGVEGVVFQVWDGGRHGKIVSLNETTLMWCTDEQYNEGIKLGLTNESDGKVNTDNVMQRRDSDQYPAFVWCRDKGKDWYLPAINELKAIFNNKSKINSTLAEYNAELISGFYWSSTESEYKPRLFAWDVYMNDGSTGFSPKGFNFYVRAIYAF